ncbi:putative protein kinase [Leishmania braziliensis MHOM/BR/75/M2904]|uniref:non-specific serine/threonine protein kinase n=2 Tax=Leishmania braziliensis TaxID=5660 RepID=E9AIC8_LEIBR|nr:putative protein kinase [Leishmania braziliensis MHOM/BR/75/M2904]CAJ2471963.1 unnamed protein product [Leishmania braziliensis]CBZ14572.1 putative protein kinase [Leishmania braziliensis MHOM/BR/75/M2904]SYZ65516.1 protein_kinase [Leishmania braziliensis MHOM/BR/75/M2904]
MSNVSSSSSSDSSSDDRIFTRRVTFQKQHDGAFSSSPRVSAPDLSAAREAEAIISESVPPLTVAALNAPTTTATTTSSTRSPRPEAEAVVLSERNTTQPALRNTSTESEVNSTSGESPAQQRPRRRAAGTGSPPTKDSQSSATVPATEPTPQRRCRSLISASGPSSELPPPSLSSSPQRRTSVHSISNGDVGVATLAPASPSTLSTSTGRGAGGRGGGGARRQYLRSAATTSLRAVSSVSASPTTSPVNVRLLSDEAYLDMFHIPALIAQLSLSLMAVKPLDPRAFTRDWLADRLVSEDDDDDNMDEGGGSINSGNGIRERESHPPPNDTAVLELFTELPGNTSFALHGSGSTIGDLASNSGAESPHSGVVSCRQGRLERHSQQRRRATVSGEVEEDDNAKAASATAGDGDENKTDTATDRPASGRHEALAPSLLGLPQHSSSAYGWHTTGKRKAANRRGQRSARKSVAAPTTSQQRGTRRISNPGRLHKYKAPASSRSNASESADGGSPRSGLLLTMLPPFPEEVSEDGESRAIEHKLSGPLQRSEERERKATAAALRSLPPTPKTSSSSSSSSFTAFNSPGSDGVEWARVALRSRRTTLAGSSASADIDTPSFHCRTTMEGASCISAEALPALHGTTHDRGIRKGCSSSGSAGDCYTNDKGAFTSPLRRDFTATPSMASVPTVTSVAGPLGTSAEANLSLAAQQPQYGEENGLAAVVHGGIDHTSSRSSGLSTVAFPAIHPTASAANLHVATADFSSSDSRADESLEIDRHGSNGAAGDMVPGKSITHEGEKDAASAASGVAGENRNDSDSDFSFAMFAPILSVDATTNEVIDYRAAGVPPSSLPACSAPSGGTGALQPYATASAGGVGGSHLTQTHTLMSVTPSSVCPPYPARPASSAFNVLPTPMLADLLGGGGLTNTSFGRRGVPNSSLGRRPANITSAAARYTDPAVGAMTGGSSPPAPFITSCAPMDLSTHGAGGCGVADDGPLASLQLVGFPKLNANLAIGSVGSGAGVRASGSADVVGELASVSERKAMQNANNADANTAALHDGTEAGRSSALLLVKDTLGPVAALPPTAPPLSATVKLESARRLGKLLDQLPAAKYAAAIVFLEGLLSSSGGSSDAAETPESASINMMAAVGDASNHNRGLLNMTNTVTDTTRGALGFSGGGSSPLIGSYTSARTWSGTLGHELSPTGRAPSFAHLVVGGSSQAPALATSGNEDGMGAVGKVSQTSEGDNSRSLSKVGSASVEALVRDALSQSVLRSLPPTHEEVPISVPSLPLGVEVSGWVASDGSGSGVHRLSSPVRLESAYGERLANTATFAARGNTSRTSSPVPVAPGVGDGALVPRFPLSQSERGDVTFHKQPSVAHLSNLRCASSSPPPPGGEVLTATSLQRQQQSQQQLQSVPSKATEVRRSSDATAILPQSLSGTVPLSSDDSSRAARDISVRGQQLMYVPAPTRLGARCSADPDEPTTPEHSTARITTVTNVQEADNGNKDDGDSASGGRNHCNMGTYLAKQGHKQAQQQDPHLVPSFTDVTDADVLISSHQGLPAHAGSQKNTATRLATAAAAAAETAESSTTVSPKALKDAQRRHSNGDESVSIDVNESTLHPSYGIHQELLPPDVDENPISLRMRPVESASLWSSNARASSLRPEEPSLLGGTESIANSGADGNGSRRAGRHVYDRQGGRRRHLHSTYDARVGDSPGYPLKTFEDPQGSGVAPAETTPERQRRSEGLHSNATRPSSASARRSTRVVEWDSTAANSPTLSLHLQNLRSAGTELEFEDVDLGSTLRTAVALAAAAGTQSVSRVYDTDSNDKDNQSRRVISNSTSGRPTGQTLVAEGDTVATEPFSSADTNEGLSSLAVADKAYVSNPLAAHSSQSSLVPQASNDNSLQRMIEDNGAGGGRVSSITRSSSVDAGTGVSAVTASITPSVITPMAADAEGMVLGTSITATTTPITPEPSTPSPLFSEPPLLSEPPLVASSVVVAMNSFFSREDQVAPEELEVVREVVAHYDAFAALDETQLETLVRTMTRAELQRGATVVREGDRTLEKLLLIVSGKLAISRKGLVTRTLARGQFYGEMEMSYHVERSHVTLTAATPIVVLYALKKVDYQKLVIHEKDARRYMFLQYVNECVLFKGLSPHIKVRLADSLRVCRLRKGVKLAEQGAPVEWMYLLMSGSVRMTCRTPCGSGRETSHHPEPKGFAASEDDLRHMATTSYSFSNFAGSMSPSEALMSSVASAAAASTVAGTSVIHYGTTHSGITGTPSSTLSPPAFASAAPSLVTYGNKPPSTLPTSTSLQRSANTFLDATIHGSTASAPTTFLANAAATHAGAADANDTLASGHTHSTIVRSGNNAAVVVLDLSKGKLVGETEFVFKCKGLFTAVATTSVQAARISRLHFEAIMTRPVVEEMKRSMLVNPNYYFYEFTVPEELKEEMRRMLFRLNVGPAARRRNRLAHHQQQQHLRQSVTGVEGTMSRLRSRSGTTGEHKGSRGSGPRSKQNAVSSRRVQHEHNHVSFMGAITGGTGGFSSVLHGTACSSGSNSHSTSSPLAMVYVQDSALEREDGKNSQTGSSRDHSGYRRFCTAPLENSPTIAQSLTERTTADSADAAGMESSKLHYLEAPTVCGDPFSALAVANTSVVSSTNAGEELVSLTPPPPVTMGHMSSVKGRGASSDSDHNRHSHATARLTTPGRRASLTKHSSTTTSHRHRVSTRGEIVFSGSRNLYHFTAEAMSMNESITIAVVADGTIIRWNSVAQSVTGYAPFEAIGKSIFDFIVSEDGRQRMRDTLAVAARFAGKWEQYTMERLQEQHLFPFRQNTGLYQIGLALSVIPSNCAKTAEVLLLIGREGKYRAASTYAADVARWLEGSLKPQLRQFQRRMAQIESHDWQLTAEDALQIRGNLDVCMSMVEQFTKFSLLNMDVVSQSWRPLRLPALLRRFATEAVAFARQQQHEYYCNIDLVEPKAEVFLDAPQVLGILRLLLGDALQCPSVDDNGKTIVVHAELRVTVVEPQDTNQLPLNIGSPASRVSGGGSGVSGPAAPLAPSNTSLITLPENHSSSAAIDERRSMVASPSALAKPSYPVANTPVSTVESSTDDTALVPAAVSLQPEMATTAHHLRRRSLPRGSPLQQHSQQSNQHHGGELARSDHAYDSPLIALVNEANLSSGGNAQGGVDSSPTSVPAGLAAGSQTSSGTGMRGLASAPFSNTLTSTLRRIRFEIRDDGPTILSLRDPQTVASERTRSDASPESASADDAAARHSTSPWSASCTSERASGEGVGDRGGNGTGPDPSRKNFTFAAASARRGAVLEQVEKILINLGGVLYGFTRPEAPGNLVRVELPLLVVPGSTDDGRDDENGGGAGGGAAAPPSSATRTLTVIVADSNRLHQQQLCRVLWARQHAVVPVTSFRDLGRKLEMNTADILLIDPLHIDIVSEDYESLVGDDPFDDIRILSARLALVVMASDFSDWRVQKLLNRHAVVELPKVGSGALVHIAMQEAEQFVTEMRDEEERLDLIRRTFTNSSAERHKIGKRIGKGAFGDVFEVEDTLTGGKMAMKRMRLHDGLLADEVVQEILAMTTLTHNNIIQHFYCEKESDTLLRLYMELAPGGTLRDKIRELPGVPLPFSEIVHHLSCICHGLAYVHEKNYVHGDLKTANLLLGTHNRTKIGDFGTAKHLAPHQLLYTMVGTPQYMAPEVLNADVEQRLGYDFKADIWSLGCIVLEMATGSPPFAHVECAQGMGIIKYLTELTDTPDLSPLFTGNPLVYEFVKSCLDIDPQNRPTAQELLHFDILEGAVASQRAERLVRRAEMLYKLNKYAAMRADGGGGRVGRGTGGRDGGQGGAVRGGDHKNPEESEEEVEDGDGNHSSLYDSGVFFSSDDTTVYEEEDYYDDEDKVDDYEENDEVSEHDSIEDVIEENRAPRVHQEQERNQPQPAAT